MCFCASPPRWRGRHRLSTIRRQRLSSDRWVPYESLTTLRTIPSTLPRRPTPTQRGSGLACSPPAGRVCSPRAAVGRPTRPRDRTEVPGKLHDGALTTGMTGDAPLPARCSVQRAANVSDLRSQIGRFTLHLLAASPNQATMRARRTQSHGQPSICNMSA